MNEKKLAFAPKDRNYVKKESKPVRNVPNTKKPECFGENSSITSSVICKKSMIPRLVSAAYLKKDVQPKKNYLPSLAKKASSPCSTIKRIPDEFNVKLQKLQEKENAIAEYYGKVEALIQGMSDRKKSGEKLKGKSVQKKIIVRNRVARKMISDPVVFKKIKRNKSFLSELENGVYEISNIWMKTSSDLANSLENLEKGKTIHSPDFETEKIRIQKAIKKARSFTLVKTRNVIAEARKLLLKNEIIQKRHQVASNESIAVKELGSVEDGQQQSKDICEAKRQYDGSRQQIQIINECEKINAENKAFAEQKPNDLKVEDEAIKFGGAARQNTCKDINPKESSKTETVSDEGDARKTILNEEEMKIWAKGLTANNNLVSRLRSRVYNLQKTFNDCSLKSNDLQLRLVNFSKKIHWDQLLVNKIEKLEGVQRGFRSDEGDLDYEGKQLEFRIKNLDEELDALMKLNSLLLKQKFAMDRQRQQYVGERDNSVVEEDELIGSIEYSENRWSDSEKIILGKRNLIDRLRGILDVMKNQKNLAEKHKAMIDAKMEDLKKPKR